MAEEELELEERDIFDFDSQPVTSQGTAKGEPAKGDPAATSGSDDDAAPARQASAAPRAPGPPRPMISRKIRRSLDVMEARMGRSNSRDLEEDPGDSEADLAWLAGHDPRQSQHLQGAQSLPVSHAKLGSSVPITIPALGHRRPPNRASRPEKVAATFQPPHVLSQQEEDQQGRSPRSFAGQLGTASVKRSRLQQRNAILRSTGFLENAPSGPTPSLGTIRETQPQNVRRLAGPGALSTAFGSSVSPSGASPGPLTRSLHQAVEPTPLA